MPRVTLPAIRDSFYPQGLYGLEGRGSQRDPSPLTTAQLSPAGPTQCLLLSCEVLGKWLIRSESQGQGRHLRWSAVCTPPTPLLAVSVSVSGDGLGWLEVPVGFSSSFPRKLSWECLLERAFGKGWDLGLMENPVLWYQLPPDFLS